MNFLTTVRTFFDPAWTAMKLKAEEFTTVTRKASDAMHAEVQYYWVDYPQRLALGHGRFIIIHASPSDLVGFQMPAFHISAATDRLSYVML
jgi:hypothetical protein